MAKLIENICAYILHTRYYTDSKLLVTFFAKDFGRISCVVRKSKKNALLQPFIAYEISFGGEGALKTLYSADIIKHRGLSPGRTTYCGMYLNELLIRLLPELEPYELLYSVYHETLVKLALTDTDKLQEILLRRFELKFLEELGLGVNFNSCSDFISIEENDTATFFYTAGEGFVRRGVDYSESNINFDISNCGFIAKDLIDIRNENWTKNALIAAKLISRIALQPLLNGKPIKARELFQ